jgi:hypothetical protein
MWWLKIYSARDAHLNLSYIMYRVYIDCYILYKRLQFFLGFTSPNRLHPPDVLISMPRCNGCHFRTIFRVHNPAPMKSISGTTLRHARSASDPVTGFRDADWMKSAATLQRTRMPVSGTTINTACKSYFIVSPNSFVCFFVA